MDKIISPNQFVFMKGRHLVDGVVVVNEIIYLARMFTKTCLIFKVGFEKACDSVSWSFLDFMRGRLCIFFENLYVLVNMGV